MSVVVVNLIASSAIGAFGLYGLLAFRASRTHRAWAGFCGGAALYLLAIAATRTTLLDPVIAYRLVFLMMAPLFIGLGRFVAAFTADALDLNRRVWHWALVVALAIISVTAFATDLFVSGTKADGMPAHGPLSLVFVGAISIAGIAWTGSIFWAWRRSGADARRRGVRPDERTRLHLFQYRWTLASLAVSFGIGIYTNGIRPMVQGDSSWGFYAPAALTLLFVAMMTAVLGGAKRIAGAWLGMRFVQAASSTSNPLDFDSGSMSALEWMRLGEELIHGSDERASVKLGGRWVSVRAGGAPARDESTITPGALKNLLVQQQSLANTNMELSVRCQALIGQVGVLEQELEAWNQAGRLADSVLKAVWAENLQLKNSALLEAASGETQAPDVTFEFLRHIASIYRYGGAEAARKAVEDFLKE